MFTIEDSMKDTKTELEKYIMQNTEGIITAARDIEKINRTGNREIRNKTRKEKWKEK